MTPFNLSEFKKCGKDVFVSDRILEIRRPNLISIGDHVAIDAGAYITTAAEIGNYVHIGPCVKIIGGAKGKLVMGDFTNLAVDTVVICTSDTYAGDGLIKAPGIPDELTSIQATTITIERFANIGAKVVIFPGVTVREGSVIAAGSTVTKDTEPWMMYKGSPAIAFKNRPKEKMLENARKLGYSI